MKRVSLFRPVSNGLGYTCNIGTKVGLVESVDLGLKLSTKGLDKEEEGNKKESIVGNCTLYSAEVDGL